MTRRSTRSVRSDAERLELALLQHAQQLRLERRAHRADLVEEDRAAVGQREFALLCRGRAGEGAANVPEQLRLEQRLRNRRAIDLDERHVALRAAVVDRARDQFLPGAGLAGNEHRALGCGNELRTADDLFHRPAAADDAVVVELLVTFAEQVAVLGSQPLMVERPADDDEELVDLERLLQVVESAELHRLDGAFDRRVRGHHQHLAAIAFGRRVDVLANQLEPGELRHHVVDDEEIERALGEQPLRLARARRVDDAVAGVAQRAAERFQNFFLVVDEENRAADVGHRERSRKRLRPRRRIIWKVDANLGAAPGVLSIVMDPPRPSMMFFAIGRPRPGAAALGREVRIEHVREVAADRCRAVVARLRS